MMKKIIQTEHAPAPIGPYSQAVFANGMLYLSGQIAIDPVSGKIVENDIDAETHRVMMNLQAVLAAVDMNFENVVKSSIFLKDMNDFPLVNSVYSSYFSKDFPARETVQVSCLPKNVNVEISMIASV